MCVPLLEPVDGNWGDGVSLETMDAPGTVVALAGASVPLAEGVVVGAVVGAANEVVGAADVVVVLADEAAG